MAHRLTAQRLSINTRTGPAQMPVSAASRVSCPETMMGTLTFAGSAEQMTDIAHRLPFFHPSCWLLLSRVLFRSAVPRRPRNRERFFSRERERVLAEKPVLPAARCEAQNNGRTRDSGQEMNGRRRNQKEKKWRTEIVVAVERWSTTTFCTYGTLLDMGGWRVTRKREPELVFSIFWFCCCCCCFFLSALHRRLQSGVFREESVVVIYYPHLFQLPLYSNTNPAPLPFIPPFSALYR